MIKRVLCGFAVVCAASTVWGAPITYHFSGIVSGRLNTNAFSQVRLDIYAPGDTAAVYWNGYAWDNDQAPGVTQLSLAGFGSGVFSDHTQVFDNPTAFGGSVGFTAVSTVIGFNDIIQIHGDDIGSAFFATYDLRSATGVYGHLANPSLWDWQAVGTSLGLMTLNTMVDTTFEATVVPEPGLVALLGLFLFGAVLRRR
jgi:hypothetical protein